MIILAIETSCDDTSVALIEDGSLVLSSIVSSQLEHSKYGGVVPEVAAREHIKNMIPVLDEALRIAEITLEQVDTIAVTQGPGLVGSLIVGVNTARTLSELTQKPLIAIHHTEGHIYANWLHKAPNEAPEFPLVCLTVSGGHTNIIYMKDHLDYQIVGETIDDAAGEAFDKVAKLLAMGYPGGPIISRHAKDGDAEAFLFPRVDLTSNPKRDSSGFLIKPDESLNFSYSGLKTAVLRAVKETSPDGREKLTQSQKNDIAASFEAAATDMLVRNLERSIKKYSPKSVLLSGGVAANTVLRQKVGKLIKNSHSGVKYFYPPINCCTDNAAMIAAAAYRHALVHDFSQAEDIIPDPNLKIYSK